MKLLEPFKEWVVIGLAAMAFIIVAKAAVSGLPDGGMTGSIKRTVLGV